MNKIKGITLAVIFGILGTIPWIILGYFGWTASLAGYLIGWAAYKGYVKANGTFDRTGKICIALIIIFTIPFAEFVNLFIVGLEYKVGFIFTFIASIDIFIKSIGEFLPNILLGYFMALLGTYTFFTEGKTRSHKKYKFINSKQEEDTKTTEAETN